MASDAAPSGDADSAPTTSTSGQLPVSNPDSDTYEPQVLTSIAPAESVFVAASDVTGPVVVAQTEMRAQSPAGRSRGHLSTRWTKSAHPRSDSRTPHQKDRDRLLYASEFRRLASVTQVVSATEGHIFHNRLTHTIKVAQIARRLAERFISKHKELVRAVYGSISPDCVEAAALAHDLGHPPFGHVAEKELDRLMVEARCADGYEGNAQSFRIACSIAIRNDSGNGLDLTRGTLNAILKYPWARAESGYAHKKWGFYASESEFFKFSRKDFPFGETTQSPEAQLMTIADDITYSVHDMEDFYRAGLIPLGHLKSSESVAELEGFISRVYAREQQSFPGHNEETLKAAFQGIVDWIPIGSEPFAGSVRQQGLLQRGISRLITLFVDSVEIAENPKEKPIFSVSSARQTEMKLLQQLTWDYVILRPSLASLQHGQKKMIRRLFKVFLGAVHGPPGDWHILPLRAQEELSRLHREHGNHVSGDQRTRVAADAISGMTEHQVIQMYQRLTGTGPGSVLDRILV